MDQPREEADAASRLLLQRYLDGDREAFGELARAHYDQLWPLALRTCGGDPDEAADALQDALMSAMRGAAGFRGEAKVSTWLHRIVVNTCLDRHRRRRRHLVTALPEDGPDIPDPRDRVAEREIGLEVERALAALPADQRAAVVLVDVEGWPVAEAALILGIPAGTVKSRCSRGRAKLAHELGHLRNPRPARSVRNDVEGDPGERIGGGGA